MSKNLLCSLFSHKFSDWKAENISYMCTQVRACKRCGHEETRKMAIIHKWNEWEYLTVKTCEQVRTCENCGTEQKRYEHQFDSWNPIAGKACVAVRNCKKCGYQESGQIVSAHQFSEWKYIAPAKCEQTRVCMVCATQEKRTEHGEYVYSGTRSVIINLAEERENCSVYRCTRCSYEYVK